MRKKQLLIFLFLLFLTLGLILPNYTVLGNGQVWDPTLGLEGDIDAWGAQLGSLAKWFFSGLIGGVTGILIIISGAFLSIALFLLNIVTSKTFINISFTGADNPFVTQGWEMIRGLTYIFIILGLIAIALATILRIESYHMKKTLPLFIIVALLINFTPMLCGLVIDASNIIMNHFLKGGFAEKGFVSLIKTEVNQLWVPGDVSGTLGRGIVFVGFNIVGGLIFFLFALLFLFRYVALWMLVILSPLALFCYIFPATKKIWDQWLNQFIQWCFIGIPAAFTIYLANIMTDELMKEGMIEGVSGPAKIFGYAVPLAFLVGGLLLSLQTGAMGGAAIIKGYKAAVRTAGSTGRQWTTAGAAALAAEVDRIRQTYQIQRQAFGDTRIRSLGTALRGSWQTRIRPAITRPATYVAAGRGILRAGRDIAMSGVRAGLGLRRRGFRRCPTCGNPQVAASAIACPTCAHVF